MDGWHLLGACRSHDSEMFFPQRGEDLAKAKAVCAGCIVKDDCFLFAIRHRDLLGVWGGTSENERHNLRRKSRAKT